MQLMAAIKPGNGVMEQIGLILHGIPTNLIMHLRMLYSSGTKIIGTTGTLELHLVVFIKGKAISLTEHDQTLLKILIVSLFGVVFDHNYLQLAENVVFDNYYYDILDQ